LISQYQDILTGLIAGYQLLSKLHANFKYHRILRIIAQNLAY